MMGHAEDYVQQQQIHQEMKEINGAVDGLKEVQSLEAGRRLTPNK